MKLNNKVSLFILSFIAISSLFSSIAYATQTKTLTQAKTQTLTASKTQVQNKMKKLNFEDFPELKKVRHPELPDEIPQDVLYMQKEMTKSYKQAMDEQYPHFKESLKTKEAERLMNMFPEDKRLVGVKLSKETYSDETAWPFQRAWSNSVYTFQFLWWTRTYPASNVSI